MERFISNNTSLDMEQCLLDPSFIKDEKKNVAQYVKTYGDISVSTSKIVTLGRIVSYCSCN
jgi:elongation factor Ts